MRVKKARPHPPLLVARYGSETERAKMKGEQEENRRVHKASVPVTKNEKLAAMDILHIGAYNLHPGPLQTTFIACVSSSQ